MPCGQCWAYRGLLEPEPLPVAGDDELPPVAGAEPVVEPDPVVDERPGVPVVDVPLETPLAGGVVAAPPALGGHGIAVPLVPTAEGAAVLPVLRPVVPVALLAPFAVPEADALFGAPTAADGEPDWASGPASVALLTVSLDDVVVPVELLIRL